MVEMMSLQWRGCNTIMVELRCWGCDGGKMGKESGSASVWSLELDSKRLFGIAYLTMRVLLDKSAY